MSGAPGSPDFETPAMRKISEGVVLPQAAYDFANLVLISEGTDPLQAFVDPDVQRHHFAVAEEAVDLLHLNEQGDI